MTTLRRCISILSKSINGISLTFILSFQMVACQTTEASKPEGDLSKGQVKSLEQDQNSLITTAIENGEPERGILLSRQLLKSRGDDPTLYNLQGLCFMAVKNYTSAIDAFRKAYALNSEVAFALNLSSAMIENGDYDKSIQLLTAMTKGKREYTSKERIYHNLGYAHEKGGRAGPAERWFRKALDENPSYFLSHMALGRLYTRTNRPAMARTAFRQASDFCALCFDPIEPLVNLYMQARQPAEATAIITRFLRNTKVRPEDRNRANKLLMKVSRTAMRPVPNDRKRR